MTRRASVLVLVLVLVACGGPQWFDTEVDITHAMPVEIGPDGTVLDMDVHVEYPHCPGTQVEVIRGNAEFAKCIAGYPDGARVPARIQYYVTEHNHHDWDIHKLGDCERLPDPDDEASFDTVEECAPTVVNGVEEGFICNHIPEGELLAACPWFARH